MRMKLMFSVSILFSALGALAKADSVVLHRDDVIPVVMQTELTLRDTREGDVFRADVADSHMLPLGSHLEGIVNRVVEKRGDRPAFMDIEFTKIILPDGQSVSIHGTPIPLSKNYVTQDRDGRWAAKKGVSKQTVVLGATAGGLVIGSLIHKPFEGAFVGALLGILAGEADKDDIGDGNIVVAKGSKVGARVDKDVSIQFDGHGDNPSTREDRQGSYDRDGYNSAGYDKYGYDRKGRYDAKYDTTRDGPAPNRDSDFDKYGFDNSGHYNPDYDTTRDHPAPDREGGDIGGLRIEINHKGMRYSRDEQPYRDGWIIMVPLRSTAEQLGFRVSNDDHEGSFRIENDKDVLLVEQDSRDYSLNHRRDSFLTAIKVRDGVAYAPIDAFTALTKGTVIVNGTKYRSQS